MKVKASVKRRCPKCKIVRRKRVVYLICEHTIENKSNTHLHINNTH
jgi:ribosomal protein L36